MKWPFAVGPVLWICVAVWACWGAEPPSAGGTVQYVPLDAPAGMSQAVVVEEQPLVYTRQLLPLDPQGNVVGRDSVDRQIEQLLDNLDAVLSDCGSGLNNLVRLHVYALTPSTVDRLRQQLSKRLAPHVRPAVTAVLTPMPRRHVQVVADAVAATSIENPVMRRCEKVAGDAECADAAVLPAGGVAYVSGMTGQAGLTVSAVGDSISKLWRILHQLGLSPSDVVQLRVFVRPVTAADEVLEELKKFFPDQLTPPVVFMEWLAPPPVEIELVARLPSGGPSGPGVRYYNPPDVRPSALFSRAAVVRSRRQIFVSGLFSRKPGRGQEQALDVFDQLQSILEQTGSDLRHLAKGTYFVCDDESARGMDRARLWLYDQDRPPAASKLMVHGVGKPRRTLTMDMIAVPRER